MSSWEVRLRFQQIRGLRCAPMITHADGRQVSAILPAKAGEELVAYATGLGQTNPPLTTGQPAAQSSPTVDGFQSGFQLSAQCARNRARRCGLDGYCSTVYRGYKRLHGPLSDQFHRAAASRRINIRVWISPSPGRHPCIAVQSNLTVSVGRLSPSMARAFALRRAVIDGVRNCCSSEPPPVIRRAHSPPQPSAWATSWRWLPIAVMCWTIRGAIAPSRCVSKIPAGAAAVLAAQAEVDGIVAVGDRPAYIAALAAERMGIPYNSPASVAASRNKFLARERFRAAGLLVPEFHRIALSDGPGARGTGGSYPCVLKPLGLSASRGVIRANSQREFHTAFRRIESLLADPDIARLHEDQDRFLQVESFIDGREFALEGILTNGELRVLALFDKPDPLDGPFFEETIYVTPSREYPLTQDAIANHPDGRESSRTNRGSHPCRNARERSWSVDARSGRAAHRGALRPGVARDGRVILRHAAGVDAGDIAMPTPAACGRCNDDPDPTRRNLRRCRRAGCGAFPTRYRRRDRHGEARTEAGSVAGRRKLSGFHLCARGNSGAVEESLRNAHRQLHFEIATALPVV